MGRFLGGHISLACSWLEAVFTSTILAFEGLYNDMICSYKMYTAEVIKGKLGLR